MYDHWSNYIPAIFAIAYILYVLIKVSRTETNTCPMCGCAMTINPDPALDTCWSCEQEELYRIRPVKFTTAYDWAKEGN